MGRSGDGIGTEQDPLQGVEEHALRAEPWLHNLSPEMRAKVLESRLERDVRFEYLVGKSRRAWHQPVKESLVLFLGVGLMMMPLNLGNVVSAGICGFCTGMVWHWLKAEQLISVISSMGMFVVLLYMTSGPGGASNFVVAAFSWVLVGFISGWLGFQRSLRGYA
jgi:hypothetical protein